ncbi:PREDICTED: uncharacterized protein LOC106105667 [Papilio polytes]|uniref:uncharacterized protein LOC106105667 n=1 Tax=Papilio polytes TaxID=76194 RepID=UPI0006765E52|nr:PREDICTED: uncharacterized protein LOC106105667 [Papilio polytes]
MALFPAYSARSLDEGDDDAARWPLKSDDVLEDELLASDTDEEMDTSPEMEKEPAKNDDYYVDCKMDNGNRRVSTLYYPGRPQYERSSGRLGEPEDDRPQRSRPRRYFRQRVPDTEDSSAVQERAAAMRRVLEGSPQDVELWEKYIDFMESYGGEKDAIDAVELAVSKNGSSRRLRMRWYAVMRHALPPQPYAERLRENLAKEKDLEIRLELWLQLIIESGLPLSTVWVRVERARAAAHWRAQGPAGGAAGGALDDGGDPQRAPQPHDVADLLRPVALPHQLFRLSVRMLMLAKVPLLCGAGWSALGGRAGAEYECGEELLGALGTARALPPRHPAHLAPDAAQRLLALFLDPPHYFTDEYGYLSWVDRLWEACCGWARGARRTALLCWRLRWLRALLLAAHAASAPHSAAADAEIRRMRADAKSILRRLAGAAPLAFAEWARLEAAAGGLTAAARAARHALRAAIRDRAVPHHHVLYIARVACEVGTTEGQPGLLGVTALVAAVLRHSQLLVCGAKQQDLVYALEIVRVPPFSPLFHL